MSEDIKISKGHLVSIITILVAILLQTAAAFIWAGRITERLEAVRTDVRSVKQDLTRRIERIEDRTTNDHTK